MTICENCIHDKVCGLEGHLEEALTFCVDRIADVQEREKIKMKWARKILHRLEHGGAMEHFLKDEHIKAIRVAEFALDELTNEQRLNKKVNLDFVENKGGLKNENTRFIPDSIF